MTQFQTRSKRRARPFGLGALGSRARSLQSGLTILSALFALVIGAIVTSGTIQGQLTKTLINDGELQGDILVLVKNAADTYAMENYPALQSDLPVTKNGVTLAVGAVNGQSLAPRVEDLVAMGYLSAGFTSQANKIENGVYRLLFRKAPAGCVTTACNIPGDLYIDQPWVRRGTAEIQGVSIGAFLQKVGGDSMVALNSNPALMVSPTGLASANPVAGNPAGIVGARIGFGASGFGRFLILNDPRDPNFQGGATVSGINAAGFSLVVNGESSITGSLALGGTSTFGGLASFNGPAQFNNDVTVKDAGGTTCVRIQVAGQIDVNCNGILNAKAGTFTGPFGVVKIGDTGTTYSVDTTGSVRGSLGFYSAVGSVFGDNTFGVRAYANTFSVQNAAGTNVFSSEGNGLVQARTSLTAPVVALSDPVVPGTACTSPALISPAGLSTNAATTSLRPVAGGGLASCVNGVWLSISSVATPGAACTTDGLQAISNVDGRSLTCHNGLYTQIKDLLSSFVLMQTYRVTNGSVVDKPTCGQVGAGVGTPIPVLVGQIESSTNASFERRVDDLNALQWTVVLRDSLGNSLGGSPAVDALFQAFCYY